MIMSKKIFGSGPKNAKVVLIGEAPGAEEEKQGKPFVGRAGKFLTKELEKFGLKKDEFYITNLVKKRCIGPPKKHEVKKAIPELINEIKKIKPKVIVLLGKTSIENVPKNLAQIYIEIPHPSAAMRFPKQKEKFEIGLKLLKNLLAKIE